MWMPLNPPMKTINPTPFTPKFGRVQFQGRSFYAVEAGPFTQLSHTLGRIIFGPWAIVENNGGGMKPIVIREGISGSRKNAEKVLAREVEAIAKAQEETRPA